MTTTTLVTGPTRSGKSEWAEYLARATLQPVVYIATSQADPADPEWQQRLLAHQDRRPQQWQTLEVPYTLPETLAQADPGQCYLVDSLGTWVANLLEQDEQAWQLITESLLQTLRRTEAQVILVAEETGWGVVPAYPLGRCFRDRLGSLIRQVGAIAESVYLVTGGYALNLKVLGTPLTDIDFSPESDCNLPTSLSGF